MANERSIEQLNRLSVMRIGVDSLEHESIPAAVDALVATGRVTQIVLARWWDFMRARRNREYRACLRDAFVLPVSKSIAFAARFLCRKRPPRHMPFDFMIRLLGALEDKRRSIYLLGGRPGALRTIEQNLRQTFPGLRIVGRYTGFYGKAVEADILTAIRKSEPNLVLIGPGVPAGDLWVSRHRGELSAGIYVHCSEVFDVFSERRNRGSRRAFERGLDFVPGLLRRPWRVLRFLPYLWFLFLLLVFRIFKL